MATTRDGTDALDGAVVLAAGLGTRMRPLTISRPKPLLEVAGRPILEHVLRLLAEGGIVQAVVNMHAHAAQIEAFVSAWQDPPNLSISDECEEILDSGGGLKAALRQLPHSAVFCLNADGFWLERNSGSNLVRMRELWQPTQMDALLMVGNPARSLGYDGPGDFRLANPRRRRGADRIVGRSVGEACSVYTGVGIFSRSVVEGVGKRVFSLNEVFDALLAKGRLYGIHLQGQWLHVGTPAALIEATLLLQSDRT